MFPERLYLASQSPRRAQLLQQISIPYKILSVAVDEQTLSGELAEDYVRRLSIAKAEAGWQQIHSRGLPPLPVLGADTSVVLNGRIMGKPTGKNDALEMLRSLSGKTHQVMTAVCLYYGFNPGAKVVSSESSAGESCIDESPIDADSNDIATASNIILSEVSVSDVTFCTLSESQILSYWNTGEPTDKAGGYAIQGMAAIFVEQLRGSYSSVVGLPLVQTHQLLETIEQVISERLVGKVSAVNQQL